MDDQSRPSEASQAASSGGSAEAPGVSADRAFNQQGDVTIEQDANTAHDRSRGDQTVVFRNHHGDRYIWPFELCSSFDVGSLNDFSFRVLNSYRQSDPS